MMSLSMVLKHKDTELLRFQWVGPDGVTVTEVNDAARKFLPLEMHGEATKASLLSWLRHRTVPKNRAYVLQLLDNLGLSHDDLRGLIGFSRGLSLNDVHWVDDEGSGRKWKSVNLYENDFSEVIAFMAFSGANGNLSPDSSSPELTTNGVLAKCWRRIQGVPVLYKSGTEGASNCGFEPYSEFYSSQIAEGLGMPHVKYGLAKFKGRLCSTCPAFTSEDFGYLAAGRIFDKTTALADARFHDLFLFDAIICNPDRHLGNFGYLVDNRTNEIVGAAPIFDNGCGLFSRAMFRNKYADEFADLSAYARKRAPALYQSWLDFPGGITPEMRTRVMRLNGFRFTPHANYNLPRARLRIIEDFLQRRIREIADFGSKMDLNREVADGNDTEKSKKIPGGDTNGSTIDEDIVANMKADPFVSANELSTMLGVSTATVKRHLAALKKTGSIRRVGGVKSGHWEVI